MNINREDLAKVCSLVRPALATKDYIPAWQHIYFDGEYATTFNDINGISVGCDLDINACVPGDLLMRALGTFSEKELSASIIKDSFMLGADKSTVKLPTLSKDFFKFTMPDDETVPSFILHSEGLKAVSKCLPFASSDGNHPEWVGVTLDADEASKLIVSATDNETISMCFAECTVKLPRGRAIMLPTFFCQQLLSLHKADPERTVRVFLLPDALQASIGNGEALLYSKTIADLQPVDFPSRVEKICDLTKMDEVEIPQGFDSAMHRQLMVQASELRKTTNIEIQHRRLSISSKSSSGVAHDSVSMPHDWKTDTDHDIDPALIIRAAKVCTHMDFYKGALVMCTEDKSFIHLISYLG
jgi:hypothetical protein